MNAHTILVLAQNEVRLRMRRLSTLVAMLAMIALGWAMIGNPSEGTTMMSIQDARVLYISSALALGSASLAGRSDLSERVGDGVHGGHWRLPCGARGWPL